MGRVSGGAFEDEQTVEDGSDDIRNTGARILRVANAFRCFCRRARNRKYALRTMNETITAQHVQGEGTKIDATDIFAQRHEFQTIMERHDHK